MLLDSFIFCDCVAVVFTLCLLMEKDKRLMETS